MHRKTLELRAEEYLERCFLTESPPHVGELAAQLGMTLTAFSRDFRRFTGESPSRYLKQAQIRLAKRLLKTTDWSMNRIAYGAAFGTRMSFYRAFKRTIGMTPESFRLADRRGAREILSPH